MIQELQENQILMKSLYTQYIEPVCSRHGLTRTELDILLFLANNPKFDTASDIIEMRHLAKSHVSTSVKALEKRNFLRKIYAPANRKTAHLSLCDAALPAVRDGQTAQQDFFAAIFDGFSSEDHELLSKLLKRISQNVRAHSAPVR